MRGSRIAGNILSDMRREEYFKKNAIRNKCILDNKKNCKECKYQEICENAR